LGFRQLLTQICGETDSLFSPDTPSGKKLYMSEVSLIVPQHSWDTWRIKLGMCIFEHCIITVDMKNDSFIVLKCSVRQILNFWFRFCSATKMSYHTDTNFRSNTTFRFVVTPKLI
jgi:hypothetical protein